MRKIAACSDPCVTSDRRTSPLGLRTTAVRLGQDDVDVLSRGANGDPAEALRRDVGADLEAERVAIETQRNVGVVDGNEHCGDGDWHAITIGLPTRRVLLRSCSVPGRIGHPIHRHRRTPEPVGQVGCAQTVNVERLGRVANMLTHDGTTSRSLWSRARYCDGVMPTISVKRELNEPSDVQPTATQLFVTDFPSRRRDFARSMRRVMR